MLLLVGGEKSKKAKKKKRKGEKATVTSFQLTNWFGCRGKNVTRLPVRFPSFSIQPNT